MITDNLAQMRIPMSDPYDIVTTIEEYEALPNKHKYQGVAVFYFRVKNNFFQHILNDQAKNSPNVKWVHSLTAGLDVYA